MLPVNVVLIRVRNAANIDATYRVLDTFNKNWRHSGSRSGFRILLAAFRTLPGSVLGPFLDAFLTLLLVLRTLFWKKIERVWTIDVKLEQSYTMEHYSMATLVVVLES